MTPFSAFHPHLITSTALCIIFSYFLGTLVVYGRYAGILSVGLKICLGAVYFTSFFAVMQAGMDTALVPIFLGFTFVVVYSVFAGNRPTVGDVANLGLTQWLVLCSVFIMFYVMEGIRLNLVGPEGLYVGNPDLAFYGGYGHSLFNTGLEMIPEHHPEDSRKAMYHFGDLWMSGIMSNVLGVLPYYASGLVSRVLCLTGITLCVVGWLQSQTTKLWLPVGLALLALYSVSFNAPTVTDETPMLLNLFQQYYPMYLYPSHLIICVLAVPVLITQFNRGLEVISSISLLWLPFLNFGMVLMPVFAVSIWGGLIWLFPKMRKKSSLRYFFFLAVAAVVPVSLALYTGRIPNSESQLSLNFVYVFIHTAFRTLLSQALVFPYWVGVLLLWRVSEIERRRVLLFHVSLYLGAILAFSFVYPQIGGNSRQLLSLNFQSLFAFIGIFGIGLNMASQNWKNRFAAILCFVCILGVSVSHVKETKGFLCYYDWTYWRSESTKNHRKWATIPIAEATEIQGMFKDVKRVKLGYYISNENVKERAHISAFVYLKAFIPGLELYRLNPLPNDTAQPKEQKERFSRTAVGFEVSRQGDFSKVLPEVLKKIDLTAVFQPTGIECESIPYNEGGSVFAYEDSNFCVPKELRPNFPILKRTNEYDFFLKR